MKKLISYKLFKKIPIPESNKHYIKYIGDIFSASRVEAKELAALVGLEVTIASKDRYRYNFENRIFN